MPRKEIYTTSKVNAREHNSKDTPKAIRQSLNRTGLEYLDCYLLHDAISGKERRIQAYKCLLEAQDKGQIRSVGVSNWNVTHMKQLLEENLPLPVVNQIEVHPWCQQVSDTFLLQLQFPLFSTLARTPLTYSTSTRATYAEKHS